MIFQNDAAGAWVALKGIEVPIGVIQHKVEAQLAARVGALAELFNPVVYLPQPKRNLPTPLPSNRYSRACA